MRGLSPVVASGGYSSSRCAGPSPSGPLLLRSTGSKRAGSAVAVHGPKPLRGMWDPPRPGPEPASPALAGRLSTTAPPGKPQSYFLTISSQSNLAAPSHPGLSVPVLPCLIQGPALPTSFRTRSRELNKPSIRTTLLAVFYIPNRY